MAKDPKQMTGYLYVLAAAVLWSLIGPFSKICMEEGLAPLEVAFWRALLGGICFFAQTGICGGARIPVKHALFFCLFGVLSISVFLSSLQISIQLSGAAMAMVLLYTSPASCSMRASPPVRASLWGWPSSERRWCASPAEA